MGVILDVRVDVGVELSGFVVRHSRPQYCEYACVCWSSVGGWVYARLYDQARCALPQEVGCAVTVKGAFVCVLL